MTFRSTSLNFTTYATSWKTWIMRCLIEQSMTDSLMIWKFTTQHSFEWNETKFRTSEKKENHWNKSWTADESVNYQNHESQKK